MLRHRPDGQCFRCGQSKKELMDDPDHPYKPKWIWCDECYQKVWNDSFNRGKFTY